MKILLVGHSLLSPWMAYTQQALLRLGHEVRSFYCTSLFLDRLTLPAGGPGARSYLRKSWHEWRDRRLLQTARTFQPELTLVLWGNTLSQELLTHLKKTTHSPLATWWVDDPFRHHVEALIPLYDFFFIFDHSYVPALKEHGAKETRFLPCACDETVYSPLRLTSTERSRYGCDVALVAWCYPERARVVNALSGLEVKIWGREWPPARGITDTFVKDSTAAKIYSAAKIGLNIHSDQTREGGLNTRSFELLACRTFQLMDEIKGMEELLEPGREVAVYRSPAEAGERARYYLSHPEEREQMARRGQERVLSQHTYLHRMKSLLREVGN